MKIIKLIEEDVRNWFGNRGYEIDDDSKITFRVVDSKSCWIFILDSHDEDNEVVAYEMGGMYCEPYDSWQAKGFSWAKKNLEELIREMES